MLDDERAANETRTRDPQLGKLMLYRLSYCRITDAKIINFYRFSLRIGKNYLPLQPQIDRDVAQLASAPRSGRGGRVFESPHPDNFFLYPAMGL